MDAIKKMLEELANGKASMEDINKLREAMDNRDKELDAKMGSMDEQMQKHLSKMTEAISEGFTKANYEKSPEAPRFKDFGQYMDLVRKQDISIKDLAEGTGALGGYTVPTEFSREILKIQLEQSIVRNRATVIKLNVPTKEFPAIKANSNADGSQYGGATAYWHDELSQLTESNPQFDNVKLEVNKLTGYVEDPNELETDSVANMGELLAMLYGDVLTFKEDSAFISGDGVKKPLGILTAPCLVTVSRATASQIHPIDLATMISRFRGRLGRALFKVNQSAIPQLFTLKDDNGNGVFLPSPSSIAGAPDGTLYGVPYVITEKASALGTEGDIILADWSHYLIGDLGGLAVDYSQHFRFQNDMMAYRIKKRVDGQPWLKSAITPYKGGSTLSPFVALS